MRKRTHLALLSALTILVIVSILFLPDRKTRDESLNTETAETTASPNSPRTTKSEAVSRGKLERYEKDETFDTKNDFTQLFGQHTKLRRGNNQRLLLEEAVTVKRDADLDSISDEVLFSLGNKEITGTLTIDEHTLSAVEATVDFTALATFLKSEDGAIRLPLSGDTEILATFDKIVTRGAHTTTLIGQVVDDSFSDILLVFHDGAVSGSVAFHDTNTHYQFAMAGNGDVAIRELDAHSFAGGCGGCDNPEHMADEAELPSEDSIEEKILRAPTGSNPFDVVVGYSKQARQSDGGTAAIEARIIGSVDRLNTALSNSQSGDWYCSLLAMIEDPDSSFTDESYEGMGAMLTDLRQDSNGPLDAVTDLKQELGADQVTFVCNAAISGTAGVAGRPGTSAICARTSMSSTGMVFAHEVGHNLGLRHAWGDTGTAATNLKDESNYGWRFDPPNGGKVRTIMAYGAGWGGSRIPYFSNPTVNYNGAPTGAAPGFNATDNSSSPAYDQLLVNGGSVGGLGSGFDGSNASLGARSGQYLIYNSGTLANKDSRAVLAVLEPAASAVAEQGEVTTIYWHGGDHSDTVQIDLYKNGVFQTTIASGISGEDRWYDWTIPSVVSGDDYAIRVTVNGSITDDSDAFTIGTPVEPLPHHQGFEIGTKPWLQASDDDYDWTRQTGGTETAAAGPDGASLGNYYIYAEGHHGLGSNKSASLQCTFNFSVVRETTLTFDYHMYGAYIDYLAVDIYDGTSWTNDVWVRNGQQHSGSSDAWSSATVDLTAYTGNPEVTVRFRTANTQWNAADPAIDNISIDVAPMPLPYAESFEDGIGAWAQSTDDDYEWTVHTGGTPTAAAGPDGASDGSYYLYAEGHHGLGSDKSASVECSFNLSTVDAVELTFDYHMYGDFIDYLAVDVHDGTSWTNGVWIKNSKQHDSSSNPWSNTVVDLSAYAGNADVTVRFRTANTQWNAADPAIDNLRIYEPVGPLVAHWSMDDGSSSVVTDDADNNFDAVASDASWVTGIDGTALEFNGSSSTVTLPASAFFTISDEISISMWVFGNETQPLRDTVFYAENAAGERILNIHLPWNNGRIYWDAGFNGISNDRIDKLATVDEYEGQWNHWVFTKNATTGLMAIFLNGELWHSATGNTFSMSGISSAAFGSKFGEQSYSGIIDDVRLYNVSLDATGISDLFTSYTTSSGVPLGWLMKHGIEPSEAGALSHSDEDIHNNELEWIFGTDPLVMDSPIKSLSTGDDVMTLSFTRRILDGVSVNAVWSPDLTSSSWKTMGITEIDSEDDGEIETVTVTTPMDTDQKFIRIRVE
ncbi:MAG: reprolysin-like metallopeptidase [Luteolibacter sp.]